MGQMKVSLHLQNSSSFTSFVKPMPESRSKAVVSKTSATKTSQEQLVASPSAPTSGFSTSRVFAQGKQKADVKAIFKAELRAEIEKNKYYPPMSRRLGQTGLVVVAFTLLEDGHIIDVRLDKPSPFKGLNESAMDAVKKVHKFRPIPPELGEERMDLKVPLKFVTI